MSGEYVAAYFTVPTGVSLSATNTGGGPTSVPITPGVYNIMTLCEELATQLNDVRPSGIEDWTVTFDIDVGGVEIELSDGNEWSIEWTSTALRDILGYADDIIDHENAKLADKQARGIWYPHCPLMLDGDPRIAPRADDGRASVSPTGIVYKVAGVTSYRQRNIRFSHVPAAYVWREVAAFENCDYETFYMDAMVGLGHPWFTAASPCTVVWSNGGSPDVLGRDVSRWQFPNPTPLDELQLAAPPWTGYVTVVLGDARSAG